MYQSINLLLFMSLFSNVSKRCTNYVLSFLLNDKLYIDINVVKESATNNPADDMEQQVLVHRQI